MMKIKRTLVRILVMMLIIVAGFTTTKDVQAKSEHKGAVGLKATNTETGSDIKFTWKKVSGIDEYKVYISTSKEEYEKAKTEYLGNYTRGTFYRKIGYDPVVYYKQIGTTKGTSYVVSGLKTNTTYHFTVGSITGRDSFNAYTDISDEYVTCKTSKYPLYQVIDDGEQEVYFYWLWNGDATVKDAKYNKAWNECMSILEERSADKTGKYPYGSSKAISTGYYLNGKEVLRSTPYVNKGSDVAPKTETKAKIGTAKISVKNATVGAGLTITWKKVSGAKGYEIYASTSKSGTYKKIGTTTSVSHTTKGLKKDKTYYIKVKAYSVASVDTKTTADDKTLNVKVKKSYGKFSNIVSRKTNKYSLYTVIDKGGDNVYFYFLSDGTGYGGSNYWSTVKKCQTLIRSRHKGEKNKGYNVGAKDMNYYINGKQVVRAYPNVLY